MSLPPVVAGGVGFNLGRIWVQPLPFLILYTSVFHICLFKAKDGEHLRSNKY